MANGKNEQSLSLEGGFSAPTTADSQAAGGVPPAASFAVPASASPGMAMDDGPAISAPAADPLAWLPDGDATEAPAAVSNLDLPAWSPPAEAAPTPPPPPAEPPPTPAPGPHMSFSVPVQASPAMASEPAGLAALPVPDMFQGGEATHVGKMGMDMVMDSLGNAPAQQLNEQDQHIRDVLMVLLSAKDLGVDSVARSQIENGLRAGKLPQMLCRDLLNSRTINKVQMARAMARANRCREIMSFLDVPPESLALRQSLDARVIALLRKERIVPLALKVDEADNQVREIHLAHDRASRDRVLESRLAEFFAPGVRFHWHFILREVAGAYWLSGESESIDTGMEAEALLDRIIGNAADARASDIHIDPSIKGEPRAIIKYRVDGFVHPKEVITMEQLDRLRVRIENLARMPKVNLNHANKGAFTRSGYDWRVQVQPHAGRLGPVPRVVLRRLQPDVMPLEVLGYPPDFIEKIRAAASASNGVILWTGPTGSGKTESIHAAVVSVNPMAKGLSVHTIEDPPEKRVPGYAVQMEIAEEDPARSGLQLLKSSLRADPDVVIFGEVRDKEMAKLVFEAANTGHLVFSTLHTNSAIDSVARLGELGINGFLLSYVRGIASQRLVRRLCVHCKLKLDTPDEYTRYVFDKYDLDFNGADLHVANLEGCPSCNFTGYYGRVAAAEWLRPSREIVEASQAGEFEHIEDMARRTGWRPMGRMGAEHIKRGITDAAELSTKILELSTETLPT